MWPFCRNLYVQKMITVVNLNIKMGIRVLAFSTAPNLRNKSQPVFYRTTQSFWTAMECALLDGFMADIIPWKHNNVKRRLESPIRKFFLQFLSKVLGKYNQSSWIVALSLVSKTISLQMVTSKTSVFLLNYCNTQKFYIPEQKTIPLRKSSSISLYLKLGENFLIFFLKLKKFA